jgi:hypothetical protein
VSVVPPLQEDILDGALATLIEADIARGSDPDCGRPDELIGCR